ncbi:MAG: FixH family protein [Alphaproteobacteria bacterium]|nr:FixH family protein [Alphaproteobacteria bacterium]
MKEITGRFVLAVVGGAFGVIIAVNLALAWFAVTTFPGLEVANSYVASQKFEAARRAQLDYREGALKLDLREGATGLPADVAAVRLRVGRTTTAREDVAPAVTGAGGSYLAPIALGPGLWHVTIEAEARDGTRFSQRHEIFVRGQG